jgi:hypothetical protein
MTEMKMIMVFFWKHLLLFKYINEFDSSPNSLYCHVCSMYIAAYCAHSLIKFVNGCENCLTFITTNLDFVINFSATFGWVIPAGLPDILGSQLQVLGGMSHAAEIIWWDELILEHRNSTALQRPEYVGAFDFKVYRKDSSEDFGCVSRDRDVAVGEESREGTVQREVLSVYLTASDWTYPHWRSVCQNREDRTAVYCT